MEVSIAIRTLRPVFAVDAHVFRAEVTRPDRGGAAAAGAEVERRCGCRCPADGGPPPARRRRAAARSRTAARRRRAPSSALTSNAPAGTSGGGDDATPVRIGAVDRRLDQRRVGNRLAPPAAHRCRSRRTAHGDAISLVAPSPPRTMPMASSRDTSSMPVEQGRVAYPRRSRHRSRRRPARTGSRWSSTRRRR